MPLYKANYLSLLQQLTSGAFFFREKRDKNGHIERLFIAPRQHTELIRQASDILMLDTTYKTNRFRMPLFNICGISQQRQPFQIASVFLEGESEARFT
ncbi:hypothetical protein IMZ48_04175 [Candidatus Bathyarchaeota archaeon]|nr:hypothetical protein [Candidatus Bathyarchaeota archaeon]